MWDNFHWLPIFGSSIVPFVWSNLLKEWNKTFQIYVKENFKKLKTTPLHLVTCSAHEYQYFRFLVWNSKSECPNSPVPVFFLPNLGFSSISAAFQVPCSWNAVVFVPLLLPLLLIRRNEAHCEDSQRKPLRN